jgi:hypothetical protein
MTGMSTPMEEEEMGLRAVVIYARALTETVKFVTQTKVPLQE